MKPSQIFEAHENELRDYADDFGLTEFFDAMKIAHETGDESKLAWAAHYLWEALPDKSYIRRHPFFQLCNMAEQIFGIDGEEEIDNAGDED